MQLIALSSQALDSLLSNTVFHFPFQQYSPLRRYCSCPRPYVELSWLESSPDPLSPWQPSCYPKPIFQSRLCGCQARHSHNSLNLPFVIGNDPVIDDWLIILHGLKAQTGQESNGLFLIFSVSNTVPRKEAGTLNQKHLGRWGEIGWPPTNRILEMTLHLCLLLSLHAKFCRWVPPHTVCSGWALNLRLYAR